MLAVNFKVMNPNPNKMKYREFDQNLESSKSRNRFTDPKQYEKILSVKEKKIHETRMPSMWGIELESEVKERKCMFINVKFQNLAKG